jgi:hypothetical protein
LITLDGAFKSFTLPKLGINSTRLVGLEFDIIDIEIKLSLCIIEDTMKIWIVEVYLHMFLNAH